MPSVRLEDLSPFGRLALKLDQEFAELERVSAPIARADLGTDAGLDDALKILNRVAECGDGIAGAMQQFAKALQDARDKAEAATKLVADRAPLVQKRIEERNALEGKLEKIKEALQSAGAGLAAAGKPANAALSEEDKRDIAAELARMQEPLARFAEAARAVKAEAARLNFKRLERQADSVIDSLEASRQKIARALSSGN
ncbi:MAG: hypothetical protein HY059_09280 [Proteobacteria bacterium]|nr:hypothetical protein [Pseudomonadota bacterium]